MVTWRKGRVGRQRTAARAIDPSRRAAHRECVHFSGASSHIVVNIHIVFSLIIPNPIYRHAATSHHHHNHQHKIQQQQRRQRRNAGYGKEEGTQFGRRTIKKKAEGLRARKIARNNSNRPTDRHSILAHPGQSNRCAFPAI